MATEDVNIKGSWVKEVQKLSVLLSELFYKSKIGLKFKSLKKSFCSATSVITQLTSLA